MYILDLQKMIFQVYKEKNGKIWIWHQNVKSEHNILWQTDDGHAITADVKLTPATMGCIFNLTVYPPIYLLVDSI